MDVTHLMDSPASSPTRTFRGTSRLYAARCHIFAVAANCSAKSGLVLFTTSLASKPGEELDTLQGLHLAPFAAKLAVQKLSIRFDLKGACTTRKRH